MKRHSASLEKKVSGEKSYLFVTKRRGPPQALPEIRRTLMFHVPEALTPKTLRSCGNSVLTTFLSILLPFILPFKLRRTGLPAILVEPFFIYILHKLLELPGDVGLHLGIFIIRRLICLTAHGLQCHALAFTHLANPCQS